MRARVRKGGTIGLNGEIFNSPSKAAEKVCGKAKNGWKFWQYERSPGDWVEIDALRK